jgi:hypothetical protein
MISDGEEEEDDEYNENVTVIDVGDPDEDAATFANSDDPNLRHHGAQAQQAAQQREPEIDYEAREKDIAFLAPHLKEGLPPGAYATFLYILASQRLRTYISF